MKRIALFAIPVVVAASIAAFVVTRKPAENVNTVNGTGQPTVNLVNTAAANANSVPGTTNAQDREGIIAIARLFAERYGTSRSDDPSVSIEPVLPFATVSLAESLNRLATRAPSTGAVVSITTTALAFTVASLNVAGGRAEVVVTTQRREETEGATPVFYAQDLALSFIREEGAWKVNSAIWANRK